MRFSRHLISPWKLGVATAAVLLCFLPSVSRAATLNILDTGGALVIGSDFVVDVRMDSEETGINAAQATVRFNTGVLSVKSIDKTNSLFNFWLVEPKYDNTAGKVEFIGGSSEGFSGKSLQILRITFLVKGTGQTRITFDDAAVTASDGTGSNVLTKATGLDAKSVSKADSVTVTTPILIERSPEIAKQLPAKPVVAVPLYPNPMAWYNVRGGMVATWDLPKDVVQVATALNREPATDPTQSEGLYDNKSFRALDDGIWYLHVRFKNNLGWSETAHYRIGIDTVPPSGLTIVNKNGAKSDDPHVTMMFSAGDQLSGIESYGVVADTGIETKATADGEYVSDVLAQGSHTFRVIARDKAGNEAIASTQTEIVPIEAPSILTIRHDLFAGEGGIPIAGTALPDALVIISVEQPGGGTVYETRAPVMEDGTWSLSVEQPMKQGEYLVRAVTRDSRGALSLPSVPEKMHVVDRPFATIFGVGIGYNFMIAVLASLGFAMLVLALVLHHLAKRRHRVTVHTAEMDIVAKFDSVRKRVSEIFRTHMAVRLTEKSDIEDKQKNDAEVNARLIAVIDELEKDRMDILKEIDDIE